MFPSLGNVRWRATLALNQSLVGSIPTYPAKAKSFEHSGHIDSIV
jgi:hypothetical protein